METKTLAEWIEELKVGEWIHFVKGESKIESISISDEENDDGNTEYSWSAYKSGWGLICQIKGQYVVYQKTLKGCKKAMSKNLAYLGLDTKLTRRANI